MYVKRTYFGLKGCILALCLLVAGNVAAQVVIGTDTPPVKGALLELKTQEAGADNVTSTKGGLVLPRVKLVSLTTLQPFIDVNDPDWLQNTTTRIKEKHVGLVVYNLTTTAPFVEGLYVWDGKGWEMTSADADNGLTKNGTDIELGGTLNRTTGITLNGNNLTVVGGMADTLIVDGTLKTDTLVIKDNPAITQGSSMNLVRNVNTGKIEVSANDGVAQMCFLQSTDDNYSLGSAVEGTGTNTGEERTRVVTWNLNDMVTNNLLTFDDANDVFRFTQPYNVEISGYLGYICFLEGQTNPGNTIVVNATIQVKHPGEINWTPYTSVRGVYEGGARFYRQTLSIPPALLIAQAGTEIRMSIVMRPARLGNTHPFPQLVVPWGTQFSKSIKIIAQ